jgi:hypothetical protein
MSGSGNESGLASRIELPSNRPSIVAVLVGASLMIVLFLGFVFYLVWGGESFHSIQLQVTQLQVEVNEAMASSNVNSSTLEQLTLQHNNLQNQLTVLANSSAATSTRLAQVDGQLAQVQTQLNQLQSSLQSLENANETVVLDESNAPKLLSSNRSGLSVLDAKNTVRDEPWYLRLECPLPNPDVLVLRSQTKCSSGFYSLYTTPNGSTFNVGERLDVYNWQQQLVYTIPQTSYALLSGGLRTNLFLIKVRWDGTVDWGRRLTAQWSVNTTGSFIELSVPTVDANDTIYIPFTMTQSTSSTNTLSVHDESGLQSTSPVLSFSALTQYQSILMMTSDGAVSTKSFPSLRVSTSTYVVNARRFTYATLGPQGKLYVAYNCPQTLTNGTTTVYNSNNTLLASFPVPSYSSSTITENYGVILRYDLATEAVDWYHFVTGLQAASLDVTSQAVIVGGLLRTARSVSGFESLSNSGQVYALTTPSFMTQNACLVSYTLAGSFRWISYGMHVSVNSSGFISMADVQSAQVVLTQKASKTLITCLWSYLAAPGGNLYITSNNTPSSSPQQAKTTVLGGPIRTTNIVYMIQLTEEEGNVSTSTAIHSDMDSFHFNSPSFTSLPRLHMYPKGVLVTGLTYGYHLIKDAKGDVLFQFGPTSQSTYQYLLALDFNLRPLWAELQPNSELLASAVGQVVCNATDIYWSCRNQRRSANAGPNWIYEQKGQQSYTTNVTLRSTSEQYIVMLKDRVVEARLPDATAVGTTRMLVAKNLKQNYTMLVHVDHLLGNQTEEPESNRIVLSKTRANMQLVWDGDAWIPLHASNAYAM